MSFRLSGFFSNNQIQNNAVKSSENVKQDSSMTVTNAKNMQIQSGSQISGEIVKIQGNDVTIQVGKDQMMLAKLTSQIPLTEGQSVVFEVMGNQGGRVSLRALYTNLDVNPTSLKALEMANLPVNEETVGMVNSMMQEGMGIDEESLQKMYQHLLKNPDVAGKTIVQMSRLMLPITPENIAQYEAYNNFNHKLTDATAEVSKLFFMEAEAMVQGQDARSALLLHTAFLDTFAGSDVEWIANLSSQTDGEGILQNAGDLNAQEAGLNTEQSVLFVGKEQAVSTILTENEMMSILNACKDNGISEDILEGMKNGTVSSKQLLSLLNQIAGRAVLEGNDNVQMQIANLFKNPALQKLMQTQMLSNWSLLPEEIAEKENLTELYSKIQEQTAKLSQNVAELGRGESALAQNLNHMQQNLAFMNQLNQTMTYVQLPLKMNNQNAHGELYVYTNKKTLAQKEGNYSAFLHLDMDHLGPVDVYVTLNDHQKVRTQFYLKDDEMIDFIAENMHILDERLKNRGYDLNASVTKKEEGSDFNVIEEAKATGIQSGSVNKLIGNYAFDVRA